MQDATKNQLQFPEVTDVDIAFGRYPKDWFKKVLAVELSSEDKKWKDKANSIFFSGGGGSLDLNRSLPEEYLFKGLRFFRLRVWRLLLFRLSALLF